MSLDFNDPTMAQPATGNYFTFTTPGDVWEGVIVRMDKKTFQGDNAWKPIFFRMVTNDQTGELEEQSLTLSQSALLGLVQTWQPRINEYIKITYTGKAGRSMLFNMEFPQGRAGAPAQPAVQQQAAPPAAPPVVPPTAVGQAMVQDTVTPQAAAVDPATQIAQPAPAVQPTGPLG